MTVAQRCLSSLVEPGNPVGLWMELPQKNQAISYGNNHKGHNCFWLGLGFQEWLTKREREREREREPVRLEKPSGRCREIDHRVAIRSGDPIL